MYRIKFERDLKELEQFGYKKDAQGNYSKKVMKDTNKGWTYFETIEINKDDRIVRTRLYQDCADQEWVGYIEKKGRFIYDLDKSIDNMLPKMEKGSFMVWTIGNRNVNKQMVHNDLILRELFASKGVNIFTDLEREILSKRMPGRNNFSETMSKEKILIFKI